MANRAADWLRQARADLKLASTARAGGSFEWACFASQQAAEKALKGAFLHLGMEAWGHSVKELLQNLQDRVPAAEKMMDAGRVLDKHYIPTRYPNGFDSGAPTDYYTTGEAETAIQHARQIIEFCSGLLR